MKKYNFINKFMAILLIFGIVIGNSIAYGNNEFENIEVEEEVSTPPITDKSIERTYDSKKGVYRYVLSKNTVFTSNIPNGMITNNEVYIDISDKVDYEFTKDGEKFNYSRGEVIDEDGIYSLTIKVENQADLKFDFSSLDFSFDSLENISEYSEGEEETMQVEDTSTPQVNNVIVTDEAEGLTNGTVFEFKFRIINKTCNNINIFNLPLNYAFSLITFNGEQIDNVKKLDYYLLNEDGEYVFEIYDTKNNKVRFTTTVKVKNNIPVLKLNGVVNGLTTYSPVSIETYEEDVTYTATCNGESIRPYNGAFSEAGLYSIIAEDEAGNKNEYSFRILYTMNISGGTVIAIAVLIIIALIIYIKYLGKHMRVS